MSVNISQFVLNDMRMRNDLIRKNKNLDKVLKSLHERILRLILNFLGFVGLYAVVIVIFNGG